MNGLWLVVIPLLRILYNGYIYMRMYVYIDLYEWIEDPRMNGLKTPNMD